MKADDESFLLLNAYRDGELSAGETLDMERRLDADPALRAALERLGTLSGAVQHALATPPAPPALRRRVVQQLGFKDPPRRWEWQSLQNLAATLLVGVLGGGLIGSGITYLSIEPPGTAATADAVLAGHLRGLVAPLPFDIASSDRHVVKPWFNGRTTIAPDAPDLAGQGFPLIGGRIDVVGGRPVPTLVYRHDRHVISVTVVPKAAGISTPEEHRDGSTIERWNVGDLTYWTVSDLDARDLRGFVDLFRAEITPMDR